MKDQLQVTPAATAARTTEYAISTLIPAVHAIRTERMNNMLKRIDARHILVEGAYADRKDDVHGIFNHTWRRIGKSCSNGRLLDSLLG
jgi:hypothetical protein